MVVNLEIHVLYIQRGYQGVAIASELFGATSEVAHDSYSREFSSKLTYFGGY